MHSFEELKKQSLDFEHRHNSRYRYSKLNGKTPLQSLEANTTKPRFPSAEIPPTYPLAKPEAGNYHLIRLIRSDGLLDVFGEKFTVPPECIYEYVRATVDVSEQVLRIHLNDLVIDEKKYLLR